MTKITMQIIEAGYRDITGYLLSTSLGNSAVEKNANDIVSLATI